VNIYQIITIFCEKVVILADYHHHFSYIFRLYSVIRPITTITNRLKSPMVHWYE